MRKDKLPKRAKFRGRRFALKWRKPKGLDGCCDDPKSSEPLCQINPNQDPLMVLDTIFHEGLHGCLPDLTEEAICDTMNSIVPILIKSGIRVSFEPGKPCPHQWYPAVS